MNPLFMNEYRINKGGRHNVRKDLYTGNPNKFRILQYLIDYHKKEEHKILIFSDTLGILRKYAKILKYPYIDSEVKSYEKDKLLMFFKHLKDWNVLFISRVGDVGIDLPAANVAIQISSLFGSRRQEAQRLGRILRPKEQRKHGFQSYFYSLVSLNTVEMGYALKRQKFLIKQGYSFEIMHGDQIEKIISTKSDLRVLSLTEKHQLKFIKEIKDKNSKKGQRR